MRRALLEFAADCVLATPQLGKRVFGALVSELTTPPDVPVVFYLDFTGVEVATASFLREAIVTFRNHVREHIPQLYPVAANLAHDVQEELHDLLRERMDALPVCELDPDERPRGARIFGQLDGKLLLTLNAALKAQEIDATALLEQFAKEENVGITAWNNRLAALCSKGLLIEQNLGRAKRYRPVLENLVYGR